MYRRNTLFWSKGHGKVEVMSTGARLVATLALGLIVIGVNRPAAGQQSARQRSSRRVIRLEAIKVEGRIQKPQAFYILQRSHLNFEGLDLKRSFIPKIIESVENDPF